MIESVIVPSLRDLGGGFQVRRALPDAKRRAIGPFVFFDQMGPARIPAGRGLDVRPHPHIGLATVTYLCDGVIRHRDSLGTVQDIRPREVNWMTAGRGIVHSERTPPELRESGTSLFGIQTWIALPREHEEDEPAFSHHESLPVLEDGGVTLTLILGDLLGAASPVPTYSPTFYAELGIDATRSFALPAKHEERGLYVVEGRVELGGSTFEAGSLVVLQPGAEARITAPVHARAMVFGGAALDAPRHVWWNFVSSRRERIEEAAERWSAGSFAPVPGETGFIPLPERGPKPVDYP